MRRFSTEKYAKTLKTKTAFVLNLDTGKGAKILKRREDNVEKKESFMNANWLQQ